MGAGKLPKALIVVVVGVALAAASAVVSAQGFGTDVSSSAALTGESSSAGFDAAGAAQGEVVVSDSGMFSTGGNAAALLSEEGTKVDLAITGDQGTAAAVAQMPPASGTMPEAAAASTQPILVNERDWSDGVKTIVECTGDTSRTCQANVYGPNGEFILGRKISPSGEAADCEGPCLDSTGAPLDASTVTRAQAAADSGAQTHKVITSAGLPPAPPAVETPTETQAQPTHHEGD